MWRNYNSDRPINQGRLRELDDLREGDRALCPVTPASYLSRSPWMPTRLVDAHQYVGIKHRDKPFEVSAPQSREKRIDHSSLFGKMALPSDSLA